MFGKSKILILHNRDNKKREQICLVLYDFGLCFFCISRILNPKWKDLACLGVSSNKNTRIRNIDRAFVANCIFEIQSKNKSKSNSNELKEYLKKDFDEWQKSRENFVEIAFSKPTPLGDKNLIPQVIWYEENQVKDSDLVTTPNDFGTSRFFQSMCKALGDTKVATQIQECYSKNKNDAYRENLEENINKIIKNVVTKKFNELYQWGSEYAFRLRLESARISLSFSKENTIKEPLALSQQSTGFQWFFSFFFNFLHSHNLNSGDIVLLDELGGSLSIPTQRDLRKFLKDFAKSKHITFIAAIHTPYMVDINHLDEIRIIEQNKPNKKSQDKIKHNDICSASIVNDFSKLDDNGEIEMDTFAKIRQAFGVNNHFSMVGGDSRIIFVEGITDYNYLTKFKLLYEKEKDKKLDIAFVPIGGLGRSLQKDDDIEGEESKRELELTTKQKNILDKLPNLLQKNKQYCTILLVDNDKQGRGIKPYEKQNLKIVTLNEALGGDSTAKYVENFFSQAEVQRLNLLDSDDEPIKSTMKTNLSRWFKNDCIDIRIEQDTKENFYTLLEYLKNL